MISHGEARVPLADVAHDRLVELVMDGSLGPGAPLKVLHLAERWGISPTPIREALARLEGEGLIVRSPMRGYTVSAPLSRDEVEQLMDARIAIEARIAASAAARARDSDIGAQLVENVAASRAVHIGAKFEEYRTYLELSAEFHKLIAEASGNRFLGLALDALPVHVQRFRLFGDSGVTDADVSLDEHHEIAAAIERGDESAAEQAMTSHIRGVRHRMLAEFDS